MQETEAIEILNKKIIYKGLEQYEALNLAINALNNQIKIKEKIEKLKENSFKNPHKQNEYIDIFFTELIDILY